MEEKTKNELKEISKEIKRSENELSSKKHVSTMIMTLFESTVKEREMYYEAIVNYQDKKISILEKEVEDLKIKYEELQKKYDELIKKNEKEATNENSKNNV